MSAARRTIEDAFISVLERQADACASTHALTELAIRQAEAELAELRKRMAETLSTLEEARKAEAFARVAATTSGDVLSRALAARERSELNLDLSLLARGYSVLVQFKKSSSAPPSETRPKSSDPQRTSTITVDDGRRSDKALDIGSGAEFMAL